MDANRMSLIQRIGSALGLEKRTDASMNFWGTYDAFTTAPISPANAQSVSAVYACVSAISETVASLPLILFKRNGEDRIRATDHPLYSVLHDQPNPHQTALEFREWMQAAVLLRGNAYAHIIRGNDGQVRELLPMSPSRVNLVALPNGSLAYDYVTHEQKRVRYLAHEVLHLSHRAGDTWGVGVSPISAARDTIKLAISERDHGVNTFNNSTRLGGILKVPGKLNPEQKQSLSASWHSQHGGSNTGRTALLEFGTEFQPISMTLEDAEWIAARQFSVEEVARLFRVPPTVIGDLRHGNYSNSVEMARQFVTMTLRRHLVMWEQAISSKLLTEAGRRIYFAEHQVEGLLRGDSSNRADFYTKGIAAGWLLPSEARKLENLPTIEGIDNAVSNPTP
jgi:HK97 family phage portal protein